MKIDRLDLKILTTLADESRQTITKIARAVGLSAKPCTTRLERLEHERVILGYYTDINFERLGELSLYHVTIAAKPYSMDLAKRLEELILANPFIVSADAVFGSLDYLLRVYARNAQHYHEIMAPFVEHRIDYETRPVSRRIVRHESRRLMQALARGEN
jgi:Lrp/AsnC family leucine-responsive transcriptional regulator